MNVQKVFLGKVLDISMKNRMPIGKANRFLLQKKSVIKDLFGHSFPSRDIVMVIPNGINIWEKLYKASTGNYPDSVQKRWFVLGTKKAEIGDYKVRIGTHLAGDPEYELQPITEEDITPANFRVENDELQNEPKLVVEAENKFDDAIEEEATGLDFDLDDQINDEALVEKLIDILIGSGE